MSEPNTDWSFTLNASGITGASGQKADFVTGYYEAKIAAAYVKEGKAFVTMRLEVPGYPGSIFTNMNIPKHADDNVRYFWRGLLESAGYTPAQLDNGEVNVSPKAVLGRKVFIYHVPASESSTDYSETNFLHPTDWTRQKTEFDSRQKSDGTEKKEAKQTKSDTSSNGASMSKAEVLQKMMGQVAGTGSAALQ